MKKILVLVLLLTGVVGIGQVEISQHYDDGTVVEYGTTDGNIALHLDRIAKDTAVMYSFMSISFDRLTKLETSKGSFIYDDIGKYKLYKILLEGSVVTILHYYDDSVVLDIHNDSDNYSTVYSGNLILNIVEN